MIKTVTTTAGVNIINFGNTADRYYWCKNIGETTLYVSAKEDISPDTDDVAILEPSDIVMIETYNQDIYVLGAGKIQIYETETNVCPFKVVKKGGGSSSLQLDENALFTGDVVFPEGITSIPDNYFYRTGIEYTGAVTSITFPTTLTSLGVSAIRYIPTLQTVNFKGNNLKSIGNYCFMANANLKELILPDGVETIGNGAIGYIYIEKLHLPASCISIDNNAFAQDYNLTDVTVGVGFNCDLNISSGTFSADIVNAIISNYADNSGKTLTIGSTNLAKLSDDDKAVATAKGLTLA